MTIQDSEYVKLAEEAWKEALEIARSSDEWKEEKKDKKKQPGDDPYYFGLSARIPNFVKSRKKKQKERSRMMAGHGQVIVDPN